MNDRKAFLSAIGEKPGDMLRRLIFADWLEDQGRDEEATYYRTSGAMTRHQFDEGIIAQDDDQDYSESGWVACVHNSFAMLGYYGHCSCFGTWEALCDGDMFSSFGDDEIKHPAWKWVGTVEELIDMAKRKADPSMPNREASPDDGDYDHLTNMYQQVLDWDKRGRVKP